MSLPVPEGGVVIVYNSTGVDMSTLPTYQLDLYRQLADMVLSGAGPGDLRDVAEIATRAGMV